MRRLILEFPKDELSKIEGESQLLQNVKTLEVLLLLRHKEEEITMICRVELETEVSNVEDYAKLVNDNADQVQLLERETGGAYIVLVKHKLKQIDARFNAFGEKGGYIVSREMRQGNFKMTFLGSIKQIRETLRTIERSGMRYRIVSLADAKFSPDSPLNALTEKQRKVLIAAYKLGYYNLPRKISSEQLAKKLNLHKSALATHRRKAELRILTQMLKE
ncbi:MAG: helix-turn-helix domain-containing protein [Candidatus Bathyarchaeia archaeon]|jgi:predicted DNA binding protein